MCSSDLKKILDVIEETKELSDDTVAALTEAIETFTARFNASVAAPVNEAQAEALEGEGAEAITRVVPAKK